MGTPARHWPEPQAMAGGGPIPTGNAEFDIFQQSLTLKPTMLEDKHLQTTPCPLGEPVKDPSKSLLHGIPTVNSDTLFSGP
jgi:hypothetical protein